MQFCLANRLQRFQSVLDRLPENPLINILIVVPVDISGTGNQSMGWTGDVP
jgi:hypothetical protein